MTDKERLEKIKLDVKGHEVKLPNVMWLIGQAERKQELEEVINTHAPHGRNYTNEQYVRLRERVQELERNLEHGAKVAVKTAEKLYFEQQKNKRYREALEFYSNEHNYEHETIVSDCDIEVESKILEDGGQKARKVLWCIHCNGKGFNGLDYCPHCNQMEKSDKNIEL